MVTNVSEYIKKIKTLKNEYSFPTVDDQNGAAIALLRLQKTYNLNATDLADGKIKDLQS